MPDVLTALDSLFLHLDSPRTPMTIGTIGVFEGGPLTAADGCLRIDEVRRRVAARLDLAPRLRQRPTPSPLGLLAPAWEDDPHFDIEMHVRQAAVPAPGSEREVLALCAEIMSWPLSPWRPLWELWLVEGAADGTVLVVEKLHHAMADGLGGVELAAVLLEGQRRTAAPRRPAAADPVGRSLYRPSVVGVAARDVAAFGSRALRRTAASAAALRHPSRGIGRALRIGDGLASLLQPRMVAPRCSLNQPIGRRRRIGVVRQRIAALRAVEHWSGATLNDVLLTAVAQGVRALHLSRGEPLHELQVLVPVGFPHGSHQLGNNVSAFVVRLPLDEEDPAACLRRVSAAMRDRKRHHQARGGSALIGSIGVALQPGIGAVAGIVQRQPFVNLVVTNVPGPRQSLYTMGARLLEAVPIVPVAGNLSLGVAALTYHGQLTVGLFADADLLPELDLVVSGMSGAFDDLVHSAEAARRQAARRAGHRGAPAEGGSGGALRPGPARAGAGRGWPAS